MDVEEKARIVIEEDVRPALQGHGGDIEMAGFDRDSSVLSVRLKGACGGCPFASETLRSQVEAVLREKIPEIEKVIRVQ